MKIKEHFQTITYHRKLVREGCFKVGLYWQGLTHDLSKFSPTEFLVGAKYYQGDRSPNNAEKEAKGYSSSWLHHKGRNKHHFEYWTDYNIKTKKVEPVEMPLRYVAEMFCDRVAASKIYNGDKYTDQFPLEYFMGAKGRRVIHPKTSDLLETLLTELAQKGEDYTFAHIKEMVKNQKKTK